MGILCLKRTEIISHWKQLVADFARVVPRRAGICNIEYLDELPASSFLRSSNYPNEVARRESGEEVLVIPLLEVDSQLEESYWVSWREEWCYETGDKRKKLLRFRMSALTVYFGPPQGLKKQLLRAEWAGPDRFDIQSNRLVFQADGAGHPHWQVDAPRIYTKDFATDVERWNADQALRQELAGDRAVEFGAEDPVANLFEPASFSIPSEPDLLWSTIHLASRADWARSPWPGPEGPHEIHATAPENPAQIRNWVVSAFWYLRAEIERKLVRSGLCT